MTRLYITNTTLYLDESKGAQLPHGEFWNYLGTHEIDTDILPEPKLIWMKRNHTLTIIRVKIAKSLCGLTFRSDHD